jgi:hypothetical protein
MIRLVQIVRDAWGCLVKQPPDDSNKGLEWLRSQERDAHDATEQIRQRRIRETERSFLRDGDFLDDELFSPPPRRRKRP